MGRLIRTAGAVAAMLLAAGALAAPLAPEASPVDPWEGWNRKVFAFNGALDEAFVRPLANVYVRVLPQPVRSGVNTFYGNFTDAWSAVNNLLQGKVTNSLQDIARLSTNVLLGLTVFDVATELGLDRQDEDLGQTFGRWGLPAGNYIVWPVVGPSTVRDSVALPLDISVSPGLAFDPGVVRFALTGFGLLKDRANFLDVSRMLDDVALDKYSFVRDAYLQRRRSLVYDGNEPALPGEDAVVDAAPEAAPAAAPPPAAASAASQAGSSHGAWLPS